MIVSEINFEELREKFVKGKWSTLKEFSEHQKISYNRLIRKSKGWKKDRKEFLTQLKPLVREKINQKNENPREADIWNNIFEQIKKLAAKPTMTAWNKGETYEIPVTPKYLGEIAAVAERIQRNKTDLSKQNAVDEISPMFEALKRDCLKYLPDIDMEYDDENE